MLEDQFEAKEMTVTRPNRFCNPVDKNGEGIDDPTAHMTCYRLGGKLTFERRSVMVENQFGQQTLLVVRPRSLCVPAEKDDVPSPLNMNHYKCYKTRPAPGTPKFQKLEVNLADQFETKQTVVIKPKLLCNPVDKDQEGILAPENRLVCYRIKDVPGQPRFIPQGVDITDQFTEQSLGTFVGDCTRIAMFCVPSTKRIPSPSGAFLDPTTDALD